MALEEIRGLTWDLWGAELTHEQTIQRIINAGFPIKDGVALTMFAIVEGESGEYLQAWHANVYRSVDGPIERFAADGTPSASGTHMKIKSIDLGFMQFNINIQPDEYLEMDKDVVKVFVEQKYQENPDLMRADLSAERAYARYLYEKSIGHSGFNPWYAYKPGTDAFRLKKRYGAKAFANWLVHSYVDKGADMDYVK